MAKKRGAYNADKRDLGDVEGGGTLPGHLQVAWREVNEAQIQKKIILALRKNGGYCWKNHGSEYSAGLPDIMYLISGQLFCFEVKRDRFQPATTLQRQSLMALKEAGAITAIVWDLDQAIQVLTDQGVWKKALNRPRGRPKKEGGNNNNGKE